MVNNAAIAYAAADYALSLNGWKKTQVERVRDEYMSIATLSLMKKLDHVDNFNYEDVAEVGCTIYMLLSCVVCFIDSYIHVDLAAYV
jgi:hypothetical protein